MSDRARVLFLCVHNSARSQMAEGLLRSRAGDRFEVLSAGSEPTHVHPLAVRAMLDLGVDIAQQRSKNVNVFLGERFDYIITLCAEEVCPFFPGDAQRLHWALPDPAAVAGSENEQLAAFRHTALELQFRLDEFIGKNDQASAR